MYATLSIIFQAILVLVLVFLFGLRGIVALEGPLKRVGKWLDRFQVDIQGIKATGADPKNWLEFYSVYRKYKKGELK